MKPYISLLLLTLLACNSGTKNAEDSQQFFVIDYEAALNNKKSINLTDIAESVSYIPLQTDSNCLVSGRPSFSFTRDYIFVAIRDRVLMYDNEGRFIRRIGTPGKGPNEIDLVVGSSLLEKEKLIIIKTLATNKLLFFDYEGNCVETLSSPPAFFVFPLHKDTFLAYDMCSMGHEDYFFRLTTRVNDTLAYVRNSFKWENNTGFRMLFFYDLKAYYNYCDRSYFKCMHNDTVFTISGERIVPAYLINLGKYQLPIEWRPENPNSKEQFERVQGERFYASSFENSNRIFITSNNYKDDMPRYVLYDKESGLGTYLVKESDESSGFINDWDNGTEFWPEGSVDDHTLYMAISPIQIKELVESEEFKNGAADEKNKKALIDLAGRLKEEDNAVVMIVTLK